MTTKSQLKELSEKLAALELQLQGQTGASGSTGASNTVPNQITVKVPRERKLRKFAGSRDDHALEEWIIDTDRATTGHSEADTVDFLMYHLEGAAREEVRLRPSEKRGNKAAILRSSGTPMEKGCGSSSSVVREKERAFRTTLMP